MRRWLWILVGLFVAFLLVIVALIGAGVYYWHQHVRIQSTTSAAAETEFNAIKRRFAGKPPLLEMSVDGRDVRVVNLERRAALARGRQPDALHVLVYDEREGKRVTLTLPFWILRLAPPKKLKVDAPHVQLDRLQLSVDDLERAGPGIVLSHEDDHVRLLVWTD